MRGGEGLALSLADKRLFILEGRIICPFKDEPCFPSSCGIAMGHCYYRGEALKRLNEEHTRQGEYGPD